MSLALFKLIELSYLQDISIHVRISISLAKYFEKYAPCHSSLINMPCRLSFINMPCHSIKLYDYLVRKMYVIF